MEPTGTGSSSFYMIYANASDKNNPFHYQMSPQGLCLTEVVVVLRFPWVTVLTHVYVGGTAGDPHHLVVAYNNGSRVNGGWRQEVLRAGRVGNAAHRSGRCWKFRQPFCRMSCRRRTRHTCPAVLWSWAHGRSRLAARTSGGEKRGEGLKTRRSLEKDQDRVFYCKSRISNNAAATPLVQSEDWKSIFRVIKLLVLNL